MNLQKVVNLLLSLINNLFFFYKNNDIIFIGENMKDKILDYIKNNNKNILLVLAYIIIACAVYVVWFNSMWHLWFVNMITIIVIISIGITIGYFYIKSENKAKIDKEKLENKEE